MKRPVDVQQAANMKLLIGDDLWRTLERREMSLDPDESYFYNQDRIRDLSPAEREPSHQLGVFFNPDASRRGKDAAAETFEWPWNFDHPTRKDREKAKAKRRFILDSLTPNYAIQEQAAIRYLNRNKVDPAPVSIRATVTLPALIIVAVVIALAVCGAAIR
jgi:hypothetical protein